MPLAQSWCSSGEECTRNRRMPPKVATRRRWTEGHPLGEIPFNRKMPGNATTVETQNR